MKKIMLMLALVMSVGLFASASNGKIKKSGSIVGYTITKKIKSPSVQWMVTVTCNGHVHTSCCYNTRAEASAMGDWMIVGLCGPYNH